MLARLTLFIIVLFAACSLSAQNEQRDNVYFEVNQTSISGAEKETLETLAERLLGTASYQIVLTGYSDPAGSTSHNHKLTQRRAQVVKDQFIRFGLDADQITLVIVGEEAQPPAGLLHSRRVEINATWQYASDATTAITPTTQADNLLDLAAQDQALRELRRQLIDEPTTKQVIASSTQTTTITCKQGTKIILPPGAFNLPDGTLVDFTVVEAYQISDMIALNLHSEATNGILATGGMIKIEAKADGVLQQPAVPYTIMMPKNESVPAAEADQMQLFTADTTGSGSPAIWNAARITYQMNITRNRKDFKRLNLALDRVNRSIVYSKDTCGCSRMYTWKINKRYKDKQKASFKEGKLDEMPPNYVFSDMPVENYSFKSANRKKKTGLSDCGDTLSNFCYTLAYGYAPKNKPWAKKHAYAYESSSIREGLTSTLDIKKKKFNRRQNGFFPLYERSMRRTYHELKVKTYPEYIAALEKLSAVLTDSLRKEQIADSIWCSTRTYTTTEISEADQLMNYVYKSSSFGWHNCDRFYGKPKTFFAEVNTEIAFNGYTNTSVFLRNPRIIYTSQSNHKRLAKFSAIPKREKADLVSISVINGKIMLAMQPIKAQNKDIIIPVFEEVLAQDLKKRLRTLN
jgi:OmpA family